MRFTTPVRFGLAVLACGALAACGTAAEGGGGGDCVSHYDSVAQAPTWAGLRDAMVASTEWGRVASLRTQARGSEIEASGDEHVVRVVDLLNRKGRRLVQVDVWRTDEGTWRSGAWEQCIDSGRG
jgi:hypothetical protein